MSERSPQLSLAEQVDAQCDRYEAAHRAGLGPRIETYLMNVDTAVRPGLFRALLELEIELRSGRGETPCLADYVDRFPEARPTIQAVLEAAARAASVSSSVKFTGVETSGGPQGKTTPVPAAEEPPKHLGRFEIRSVLGEGAFGTVYQARDPRLDRDVALKVPRFAGRQSREERERFLREARAAAGLQHPHICPVHEVGTIGDRDYIVLAFIDGKPLSKLLQSQPKLSDRQIAAVIRKLALALQEAHDQGIIHRDLKPANIMINRKGEPVIMDFGLARRENAGDAQISHSGQIMGTPAYMSPEQARGDGKTVGPASDIYGLGVVFYELLCGRRPFEGTISEVLGGLLHVEAPQPATFRPTVDPRLQALCMRAIAKSPAERFASMREFAASLADYARATPVTERSPAPVIETNQVVATNQFAGLLAAISSDVESKVERAVKKATPPRRSRGWTYLAGSALMGLIVLLGMLFFIRKETVTVIVNIPIKNLHDPSLSFLLDNNPLEATAFAAPIELKPGRHELVVNQDGKLFKRFVFDVGAKQSDPVVVQDVTPRTKTPEELLASLQGRWIAIEQARGGATLSAEELAAENKVMTISGDRFSIEYQLPSKRSERGKESGTITRIDPNATPAEIDMLFERGTAESLSFKGIFELNGERQRHCYRKCHEGECLRPTHFTTEKEEAVMYVDYMKGPADPIDDGWVNLFNGKDLAGWEVRPSRNANWRVGDEVLSYRHGPRSHLVTDRDYHDFHLTLEMRQNRRANSGIWFWCAPTDDYPIGFETEISATQPMFAGSVLRYNRQGWAEAYHAPKDRGALADQWCPVEVIVKCGRVRSIINGVTGVDVKLPEKYPPGGRIALQSNDHETQVEFRNIRIKELKPGYVCEWDSPPAAAISQVANHDRTAAESLLALGGGFVKVNGQDRQIRNQSGLPLGPFRLTGAYFAEVQSLDDNALAVLKGCEHLTELDLRGTRVTEKGLEIFRGKTNFTSLGLAYLRVTDQGLEIFQGNKQLKWLYLHDTFMTDHGLSLFHDCQELGTVWVGGTPVTDAGILPFQKCKFLKWLDVRATKVTREGVRTMKAALPACRIDADPDKR